MLAFSRLAVASAVLASSAFARDFTVKVGADGLTFTPNQINAVQGDFILFEFHPKNHTLTQSSLNTPCEAVPGGGDTGFVPVAATETQFPVKRLPVPDSTTPLWFFCKQANHCQQGMVFALNPGSQDKMTTFINNAKGIVAPPPASTAAPPPATSAPAPPPGTTSTAPPAAPTDAAGTPQEIVIQVGAGGLSFTPDRATAKKGDTVIFHFAAGNHTVTQSTFQAPCSPAPNGAASGFRPIADSLTNPNFTFVVPDDSKPLWFYCQQANHCQQGMVFSLNAPATGNTADAFKAAAMGAAPGGAAPPSDPTAPPPSGASPRFASGVAAALLASVLAGLLL